MDRFHGSLRGRSTRFGLLLAGVGAAVGSLAGVLVVYYVTEKHTLPLIVSVIFNAICGLAGVMVLAGLGMAMPDVEPETGKKVAPRTPAETGVRR